MQYYRFEVQGFAIAFMNIMDDIALLLLFLPQQFCFAFLYRN